METYCGKSCDNCTKKEQLACPGCRMGPGRQWSGTCEIAKCCQQKNHATCDTCTDARMCGKRGRRDGMAEQRIRKLAVEAQEKAELERKAPFLGKWLWVLFWLVVPSIVAGLIGNDTVVGWVPALRWPGQILSVLCQLARGLILLKLAREEQRYRTAGILILIAAAVDVVTAGMSGGWTLLLTLPAAVAGLVGQYHLYMGHAEILYGVDNLLAEKWRTLWKWNIGALCATIGGMIFMLLAPRLGLLLTLAALIALLVVSIVELVYLYRTAKCFRD